VHDRFAPVVSFFPQRESSCRQGFAGVGDRPCQGPRIDRRRARLALLGRRALCFSPASHLRNQTWPARLGALCARLRRGEAPTDSLSRVFCQEDEAPLDRAANSLVENRVGRARRRDSPNDCRRQNPPRTVIPSGMGGIANNVIAIGTYAKLALQTGR